MAKNTTTAPKYKVSDNGVLRDATAEEEAIIEAVRTNCPTEPTPVVPA